MIIDPAVLPGLLLLAAELAVLAAVGYIVVRVALRQEDELSALAQGFVVGPALWGIVVNFIMYAVPGLAGAAVGWGVTLLLAGGLAWHAPARLPPSMRTLAGFASAVLVLGWAGLASRQLVGIADPHTSLGMAASIRAGGFPVALPWDPEATGTYHYGASLLAGLLAPVAGPDLAFVWELLGVYAWVGFALVVGTALRRRGSWLTALALSPLLLSYGLHTIVWTNLSKIDGILWIPVPAGIPGAGLRADLADLYRPVLEPAGHRLDSLPDIWNPAVRLGYALAIVVLAHAAQARPTTWPGCLALGGLVGFLGLTVTTLAPVLLVLWGGLESLQVIRARRARAPTLNLLLRSSAGLAWAGLLLVFGGGVLSGAIGGGTVSSGLTWSLGLDNSHWPVLGGFEATASGVGLLRLGPVLAAGVAVVLARRDRLVLALSVGASLLSLAWLALEYPSFPEDLRRLAGHARNFALVALLLALSARLTRLPSQLWRLGAIGLFLGLVVWPTVVAPARSLGGAMGRGVELANADWAKRVMVAQDETSAPNRDPLPAMSDRVAAVIRAETAADARVLDATEALAVLLHTGRPNNSGFDGVVHLIVHLGPEYLDARYYLEPAAFRRLGLAYVYATDAWEARLPKRARGWLADPRLFDVMVRDGAETLYRVRPPFLALEPVPHPDSFEALRAAVALDAAVYLPPQPDRENSRRLLRVASVLSHARLEGTISSKQLHLVTPEPWQVAPSGVNEPEFVALPQLHEAWVYPPAGWREIWRNPPDGVAVYARAAASDPWADSAVSPVSVRVTDVQADEARLMFTAMVEADASREWMGQDWVLVPIDMSPTGIPTLRHDGRPVIAQWFAGQVAAGAEMTTHTYVFDAQASTLAVRGADGASATVQASQRTPSPGAWMLALRLTRQGTRGVQEAVAIIPVLRVAVSTDGTVSYNVYTPERGWRSP